jgi:predicted Fe-S protein YdhL (DUF1289 family)
MNKNIQEREKQLLYELDLIQKLKSKSTCNFCLNTLDEFITLNDLTPSEREHVVKFAMFMERKRLERNIHKSINPLSEATLEVIC